MPSSLVYYETINDISWQPYQTGLALPANGVHAWLVKMSDHLSLLPTASIILDGNEIARAERYRKEHDRNLFMVGRIVLRQLLAGFLHCEPKEVPITLSAHKKPVIENSSASLLNFNVSHSGNYILIGISKGEIGVDIENTDRSANFKDIMQYSFAAAEIDFVNERDQNSASFFTLWTRKESLLKTTGKGLTNQLSKIVALDGKWEVPQEIIESSGDYRVSSLHIDDNYIASICRPMQNSEISFLTI